MKIILKSRQNGFAIIEALIAFLLLGIGVAALLYLQGNLMSGSSISKARAEAMELAKDRTEILRNNIHREQYLSALRGVIQNDPVTGVNAEYIVCYDGIPIIPPAPTIVQVNDFLKNPVNLEVIVKWPGAEGDAVTCSAESSKDEQVSLETMLYFMSPVIVSAIDDPDSDGDGGLPPLLAPWIAGKEGKDSNPPPSTGFDENPDVLLDGAGNSHTTLTIKSYYNYNVVGGVTSYNNLEVLAFVDTNGDGVDDTWKVVLTSFGGIVHKLQGEVIIGTGANTTLGVLTDDLDILASPPSYCVFPICDGGDCTDKDRAKYVCYVPGDCTYQDDFVLNDSGALNGCPPDFVPPTDDDFHDLNGGWYGRVGNFGVAIHPDDKVCTFETDIDAPKTNLTPSRSYVKYRCKVSVDGNSKCPDDDSDPSNGNGNIIANEGTNRPYSNQDFMIIRKNQSCDSDLVTSRIEGTPLVGTKTFLDGTGTPSGTWGKNVVLLEVTCDTDPTSTDPSDTDGSCLHP